jgi:DNA-binding MarR family transcriptional regulator
LSRHAPLDLSEHLPYLINRVGSALVARFSADGLARVHLSIVAWRVLAALSNNGGLRQTDLAELTSIDASTLSRLITRLVRDGLVGRTRSQADSREVVVALTTKGKTLMARLVPVAVGLQNAATRRLSKRDLATLKRVLRKMHDNLTQEASERVPRSGTQGVPYLSPRAGRGRRAKRGG